jgi:uncharacterized membrane protein YcjF (UPF0283 family)
LANGISDQRKQANQSNYKDRDENQRNKQEIKVECSIQLVAEYDKEHRHRDEHTIERCVSVALLGHGSFPRSLTRITVANLANAVAATSEQAVSILFGSA